MTSGWKAFEKYAHRAMEEYRIPGMCVAVSENGEITYTGAFGLRDRDAGLPVTADTVFGIASISKSFTAAAIMQLCEAGKINAQHPVVEYLPEFCIKGAEHLNEIRIVHLLAHCAGIPPLRGLGLAMKDSMKGYPKWDPSSPEGERKEEKVPDLSTFPNYLEWLANEDFPMLGRPGEYFSYSNDSYCILGALIEKVTGRDYYEYMETEVLKATGMERSTFSLDKVAKMENVTRLYMNNIRRETKDVPQWQHIKVYDAGGGIRGTAIDLVRYASAYITAGKPGSQRLVSQESVKAMYQPVYKMGRNSYYAYGFMVTPNYAGKSLVQHGGSLAGVSSNLGFIPEAGVAVSVLTNVSGAPAADIWLHAVNTALGLPLHQKATAEPRDYQTTMEDLLRYAGTYKSLEGAEFRIVAEDNELCLESAGERFALRATSENTMAWDVYGQERTIKFYSDNTGTVWAGFTGLRMVRKVS